MLWRIVHPKVPFCFYLTDTAENAVKMLQDGLHKPDEYEGITAVPLTLEDIEKYLREQNEEARKEHAAHPERFLRAEWVEDAEIGAVLSFGVEF